MHIQVIYAMQLLKHFKIDRLDVHNHGHVIQASFNLTLRISVKKFYTGKIFFGPVKYLWTGKVLWTGKLEFTLQFLHFLLHVTKIQSIRRPFVLEPYILKVDNYQLEFLIKVIILISPYPEL